ncbi:MAG: hypothetical protein RLZZ262_1031 [Bacteroidota bacterium]|jgi:hypothetical protein
MKNYSILLLFAVLTLMAGCSDTANLKWNKVEKGTFSFMIPDIIEERTDLNEEADLQYGNLIKEVYVVVLEEPVSEVDPFFADTLLGNGQPPMEQYSDLIYNQFSETGEVEVTQISERERKVNTTHDVHTWNCTAKNNGFDAYYEFAVYRSEKSYYQVIAWTLLERKDKYKDVLQKMVNSLQPL